MADVKNETDLRVVGESQTDLFGDLNSGKNLIKFCKGSVPKTVELESVGLSASKLKDGVSCVAADFNGDGFLDFVLYGSKGQTEVIHYDRATKTRVTKTVEVGRNLLAVFFQGPGVLRTQLIKNSAEVFIFEAKDPNRKKYPKANPLLPGLLRPGQGDRGWVYFLNEKTGLFEEVPWVMPPGYD